MQIKVIIMSSSYGKIRQNAFVNVATITYSKYRGLKIAVASSLIANRKWFLQAENGPCKLVFSGQHQYLRAGVSLWQVFTNLFHIF